MKKLLLVLALFLTGCVKNEVELSFTEKVDEYIIENNVNVIDRITTDEELILFDDDELIGMIQFIEDDFVVIQKAVKKEYEDGVELLYIGNETQTYFAIIIHEESLFNTVDSAVITLLASPDPVVFEFDDNYEQIWAKIENRSITSCAAEKIELFNGDESIYVENFIPVWGE